MTTHIVLSVAVRCRTPFDQLVVAPNQTHDTSPTGWNMLRMTERAVLAGGCFCGVEERVRTLPGAISTRVGHTGGDVADAAYRHHGTHAEAIEIIFDPSGTTYRDLLECLFQIHDPTTKDRQGYDLGVSYRSAMTRPTSSAARLRRRSLTSTRPASGRARS